MEKKDNKEKMENIQIQTLEDSKFRIQYTSPPETVVSERDKAFDEFAENDARNLVLKGFRKGKAPKFALKLAVTHEYKQYFERKVAERLLRDAVEQIQFSTGWKMLFQPEVNDVQLDDKAFSCDLTVLKRPDVKLAEYKGMIIPKPHVEISEADRIQSTLQSIRVQFGDNEPFGDDDFISAGDKVTMDAVAMEGEAELMKQEGMLYTVGDGSLPKEVDDQLVGMKAGEEKSFATILDEKNITWKVKVHMGLHIIPAALDDSLAEKTGLKTLAEMEEKVAGMVTSQLQQEERSAIKQQILLRLIDGAEIDIPNYLLDMEMDMMIKQKNLKKEDLSEGDVTFFKDLAGRQVKLALAFDQISQEQPELQFSDQEILENLKGQLLQRGQNADEMIQTAAQNGSLAGAVAALKHESIVEWLIQQSQIVD